MTIFDYSAKRILQCDAVPEEIRNRTGEVFLFCRVQEVPALRDTYDFDESTMLECTNLDESVRYASFDGYDFVSLVHEEIGLSGIELREINLYISKNRLIYVAPKHESPRFAAMEDALMRAADLADTRPGRITRLYAAVFQILLADYSDMLERLEGWMEELSEGIARQVDTCQLMRIAHLRRMAYTAKKQLRAVSYIGGQLLVDENGLLDKRNARLFKDIEMRVRKLHDFAESLYGLSGELHLIYDSKMQIRTNDTVGKLTILTLFFGPLTVITGIYGMNFTYMPELSSPWGYPAILAVMAAISALLYLFLKKKKWL